MIPAGISNWTVTVFVIYPLPWQSGHLTLISLPVPLQYGHVVCVTNVPNGDCCCLETVPVPLQCEHVCTSFGVFAPLPWQWGHSAS